MFSPCRYWQSRCGFCFSRGQSGSSLIKSIKRHCNMSYFFYLMWHWCCSLPLACVKSEWRRASLCAINWYLSHHVTGYLMACVCEPYLVCWLFLGETKARWWFAGNQNTQSITVSAMFYTDTSCAQELLSLVNTVALNIKEYWWLFFSVLPQKH